MVFAVLKGNKTVDNKVRIDHSKDEDQFLGAFVVNKEKAVREIEDKKNQIDNLKLAVDVLKQEEKQLFVLNESLRKENAVLEKEKKNNLEKIERAKIDLNITLKESNEKTQEALSSLDSLGEQKRILQLNCSSLTDKYNLLSATVKDKFLESQTVEKKSLDCKELLEGRLLEIKKIEEEIKDLSSQVFILQEEIKILLKEKDVLGREMKKIKEIILEKNNELELLKKSNVLEAENHKKELNSEIEKKLQNLADREGSLSRNEMIYNEKIGRLRETKKELEVFYNRLLPNLII